MKKHKVHTRYKLKDGTPIAGTTTIIGILAKPALINWAWKLGCQGIDYKKVRDTAGDIGTIAHYLIQCHLKAEKADLTDYPQESIDKARVAFQAFLDFEKQHDMKPILVEGQLVDAKLLYGGTIDFYGTIDGKLTLLDFKTGSGLWPEMRLQVAAYRNLLQVNGHRVDSVQLLRIDKNTGEFHHHMLNELSEAWHMFKLMIPVARLKNKLWKR